MQRIRHQDANPERYRLYLRAIWIAVVGNSMLVVAKGSAAWFSGSTAIFATAVDSVTDVVYTIFLAWGLRLSQQPADDSHPQGHTRIEPVVSTVIALMMGLAGWEVVRRAFGQILAGSQEPLAALGWPAGVLAGSGLVKILMYVLVRRLAERARSPAISASARDNLSDVFSSATALVGILAAGWPGSALKLADPIAAMIVSLWIFRNVLAILHENMGYLTGRAAEPDLVEQIHQAARGVEGVEGVHRIIADYVGPQLRVDMHVDVGPEIPFRVAHGIHSSVQKAVEGLDTVDQAFIHLEPVED